MRIFEKCYDRVIRWSQHPKAVRYLGVLSFIDSSVFPVSPLFMLIPMTYAKPGRAFYFASITSFFSILGGLLGYALGFFVFQSLIHPIFEWMGYLSLYNSAMESFSHWGYWAIFLGCFTPFIPFKIFTIGAGVLQLHLGWFLLVSSLGRVLRFFIIAAVILWGGTRIEPYVRKFLLSQ